MTLPTMSSQEKLFQLTFKDDQPVALVNNSCIMPEQFRTDIRTATDRIDGCTGDLLITCRGRYEFTVALLAAWLCGRLAILPPNNHPATLNHIRKQHAIGLDIRDGFLNTDQNRPPLHSEQTGFDLHFNCRQEAIILYTSGSTGLPRPVRKRIGNLISEIQTLIAELAWPDKPVVASVPPNHLYGLTFSVLLPLLLQVPIVDACPLHAEEVDETIRQTCAGTLITVPVHLQSLLGYGIPAENLMTVASAGPLSQSDAQQWTDRYHNHIVEIYGSSETGIIARRRQLLNQAWHSFSAVQISSSNDGLLQVRSPFIHPDEGELFQTGDRITTADRQGFNLLGRADSIIKIAGKRVSLSAIEAAIKACDGITDAAAIAVPVQGQIRDKLIWAAVATDRPDHIDARTLRRALADRLDPIKIPRRFVITDRLPREANGKLTRQLLISLFSRPAPDA